MIISSTSQSSWTAPVVSSPAPGAVSKTRKEREKTCWFSNHNQREKSRERVSPKKVRRSLCWMTTWGLCVDTRKGTGHATCSPVSVRSWEKHQECSSPCRSRVLWRWTQKQAKRGVDPCFPYVGAQQHPLEGLLKPQCFRLGEVWGGVRGFAFQQIPKRCWCSWYKPNLENLWLTLTGLVFANCEMYPQPPCLTRMHGSPSSSGASPQPLTDFWDPL